MTKKDTVIDYEKVLQHVGPLGLWQFLNLCVLFSVTLCGGIAVVTFAFAGYVPDYRSSFSLLNIGSCPI